VTPGMRALRHSAALCVKEHVVAARVEGPGAYDLLDRVVAGDLFAQSGRMRHSLLLREDGTPLADVYVCADDDAFLLVTEGVPGPALLEHLDAHRPPGVPVTVRLLDEDAVVGIDGPYAWEVVAEVVGPEVQGLPYLTFYTTGAVTCLRAGKTGEYGFDLLVPRTEAERWSGRVAEVGRRFDLERCELGDLDQCALENWFFNPRREGVSGATPLELQLQWRVSRRKAFVGAGALAARRAAGVSERLVCLVGSGPVAVGDEVAFSSSRVGRVVNAGPSPLRGDWVATALVARELAHAGVGGFTVGARAAPFASEAPPVLNNRSLYVHPQRHSYLTRGETDWPPIA
jgi:glycine cleavage system aminomethyltransferase T